ncbi:MAG: carboxylating nicotinate-nucleotide diphosphorylase [Bacteroidetes bacterium]|jgi:nicotinate-nucleotide pyrophosphorylase (carboxylating)|nr:carboxylating nicotinate-nucleotide diphosphorylase [Bacteroidota bacterium]MDA8930770.1 carboxylating nicotinate-nucleotide diphosphorylase [Bacteroidia bacterium]
MDFNNQFVKQLIDLAIAEDIGDGDHSSLGAIPAGTQGQARLLVKDEGILCGVPLARHIMERIDADVIFDQLIEEGAEVTFGDIAFTVKGSVHSILQAERLMLNFMQRMSGVATVTHNLVKLIEGTNAKLLDTRKTTPGLRTFEKYAVTIGGGVNHRFALWDMVMLKDNHNDYAGGITGGVTRTKEYLKSKGKDIKIEVETRDLNEVQEALDTGLVDRIMFDNFTPELMVEAVKLVNGQCETEASGGITGDTVRSYAETGVDYISVGALTHSVRSLDLSLKEF